MPYIKALSCPTAAAKASLHFHQWEIGTARFLSKILPSDYTSPSWGIR